MSATKLYTPEVLGLATSLAQFPWIDDLPLAGEARSRSCGSSIALGISLDEMGRVERLGVRSHACAVGQAAAAIFAQSAVGRTLAEIADIARQLESWLGGGELVPDWPGIAVLAPARDYPARHGAIMLAWKAAIALLPSR